MEESLYFTAVAYALLPRWGAARDRVVSLFAARFGDLAIDRLPCVADQGAARAYLFGQSATGEALPFVSWLDHLDGECRRHSTAARIVRLSSQSGPLADHVAAAFAGPASLGISIGEGDLSTTWVFARKEQRRVHATGTDLLELALDQRSPTAFLAAIRTAADDYSRGNLLDAVSDEAALRRFLVTDEASYFLDYDESSIWAGVYNDYVRQHGDLSVSERWLGIVGRSEADAYTYTPVGNWEYFFVEADDRPPELVFHRVEASADDAASGAASVDEAPAVLTRFRGALARAEAVAQAIDSPFAEAFAASLEVAELIDDEDRIQRILASEPPGEISLLARIVADRPRSDTAAAVMGRIAEVLSVFEEICGGSGDAAPSIVALFAAEIADVFGGMGTWNDQVPPPEHAAEFDAASAELYEALQGLRAVAVSHLRGR